jgi:hypothetical protein
VEASEPNRSGHVNRILSGLDEHDSITKTAERFRVNPIGVASPPLIKNSVKQVNPRRGGFNPAMGCKPPDAVR